MHACIRQSSLPALAMFRTSFHFPPCFQVSSYFFLRPKWGTHYRRLRRAQMFRQPPYVPTAKYRAVGTGVSGERRQRWSSALNWPSVQAEGADGHRWHCSGHRHYSGHRHCSGCRHMTGLTISTTCFSYFFFTLDMCQRFYRRHSYFLFLHVNLRKKA
jgi:hypothetical protein